MIPADNENFAKALLVLGEVFGEQISEARLEAYRMVLAGYEFQSVESAIQRAMTSLRFFPKPAELVEMIEGNADDRANQAWSTFFAATTDSGYSSAKFLDPASAIAVDAVFQGWIQACQMINQSSPEMLAHYRNHFLKQYAAARRSGRDVVTYRPGLSELSMRGDAGWKDRFQRPIVQPVLVIGMRETRKMMLPFDVQNGTLTAPAMEALTAGVQELQQFAQKFIGRAPSSQKALGAVPQQPATKAEIAEILAEATAKLSDQPRAQVYLEQLEAAA